MAYRPATSVTNGKTGSYDPYEAVRRVYDLKGDWDQANKNNDTQGKTAAASTAQQFYNQLRRNGYSSLADDLTKSDYGQSKVIRDYYAKTGRTATRPYLYSLGKKYGKSEADIDKLTTWDNDTGQIYFGGQLLGTPDTISSDGVSYWNSTNKLDSVFNDVAAKQGWTADSGVDNAAYNQTMQSVKDMDNKSGTLTDQFGNEALKQYQALGNNTQAQFDYANQDITKTDEYKSTWDSIMPAYEYASDRAALNAAADSASTNGGNIDSFAAANARRQRDASLATGQQIAAEQARQAYLDRISGMNTTNETNRNNVLAGAQAAQGFAEAADIAAAREQSAGQSYYDNWQDMLDRVSGRKVTDANAALTTAQANQIDAETSNRVPTTVLRKSSPYFDSEGNVNTAIDYRAKIDEYEKLLNTELAKNESKQDKTLISNLKNELAWLEDARGAKTLLDEYKQYANDGYVNKYSDAISRVYGPSQQEDKQISSSEKLAAMNNASAESINAANNASAEKINAENNASAERINTENNQNALDQIDATTDSNIKLYNATGGTTGSSSDSSSGSGSTSSSSPIPNSNIDKYIEYLNNGMKSAYGDDFAGLSIKKTSGMWTTSNALAKQYMIKTVYSDTSLTDEQASAILHAAGISDDDIEQYSANSLTNKWNNGYASADGR